MAIHFRVRDFLQPLSLTRYRALFDRAQWWPPERLRLYQEQRLRQVLRHAAAAVPFYREALHAGRLHAADIRAGDLARLPILTKEDIRARAADLVAGNARRYGPRPVSTTGSTKLPVTVLLDRRTNALEFAFYWRHWGWFGYRLGDRFAQLSWSEFAGVEDAALFRSRAATGRLLLNARHFSSARAAQLVAAMRDHKSRFLKGHPSALLHFALFLRAARLEPPPLRALFSTGEVLEPSMRSTIQDVFQAPVADAYGQMERVVAACECPSGRMHLNPDYGWWELADERVDPVSGKRLARIVGSGLHNMSMPLLRYDTGDLVEIDDRQDPCPCGRRFATIGRLHGRSVDAIISPDGRVVTVASIVFNQATALLQGQLVQHEIDRLVVRALPAPGFGQRDEDHLIDSVRRLIGPAMKIELQLVDSPDAFEQDGRKHRPVVSTVYQKTIARGQPLP